MYSTIRNTSESAEVWGIVGGLGPRASAEFLKTIYEYPVRREQDYPRIALLSQPDFPDRTTCLTHGDMDGLERELRGIVERLLSLGSTRIVVCCMTIHAVIPRLPVELRSRILSLVDLLIDRLFQHDTRHLMLCTSGCRAAGVVEMHPGWPAVRDRVVWPDATDQGWIHRLIYDLKSEGGRPEHVERICDMVERYGVTSWVAGCTELHLLTPLIESVTGQPKRELCLDPLLLAADLIADAHAAPVNFLRQGAVS